MKVQECMSEDVEIINPNTTLQEAAQKMRDGGFGALPVAANDRLQGMVTDRDIVIRGVAENKKFATTPVAEVMSNKILYCFEEDSIEDVADKMADNQIRRMPVLNAQKRLVGIIALADLSNAHQQMAGQALSDISQPMPRH